MRYGFCTDIATKTRNEVEYSLLERIKDAGYDYVEFPLMMIETLTDDAFEHLLLELKRLDLACDCSCNFFPSSIKVIGPERSVEMINTYLEKAMSRAARLGVKKIVFGSCPSRNLPEGMSEEEGYKQLLETIKLCIIPACIKHSIYVVMEPIRRISANFIVTLKDGQKVVDLANAPQILLLADLMHMLYNEEDPETIKEVAHNLRHVHLCEKDRVLPEEGFSNYLEHALSILISFRYNDTISYESKDAISYDGMKKALNLLKGKFNY